MPLAAFYLAPSDAGYVLTRGETPIRTPAGHTLLLPTEALGQAILAEWQAEKPLLRRHYPLTHLASLAHDRPRAEVMQELLAFLPTDLLRYRDPDPALHARQETYYAPWLAWANTRFGFEMEPLTGLASSPFPTHRFGEYVAEIDDFTLAALSDAARLLHSSVLAAAFVSGLLPATDAYALATLEETYQSEEWGEDVEKQAALTDGAQELNHIERFLGLIRADKA